MRKTSIFIIAFCVMLLESSCDKSEMMYSCNPEINEWATKNVSEIRKMSLDEFLNIEVSYQKAAFRAFTPEQRLEVWIAKANELLQLNWNAEEKEHIGGLVLLLEEHEGCYNETRTEEQMDKFSIAIYRWYEYSKDVLKWDDNLLAAILKSPNRLLSIDGQLELKTNLRLKRSGESGNDCNCNFQNQDTFLPDCRNAYQGWCAYAKPCDTVHLSCGVMWLDDCNSMCV